MNYTYIYPENLQHHSESTRSAITPADNKPSAHSATTYRINIPMTNSSYTSFPGILAIRVNRARQKIPRTQYILAHCTQLVKDQPSPYIYIYMNTPSSPRTARVVCPSARWRSRGRSLPRCACARESRRKKTMGDFCAIASARPQEIPEGCDAFFRERVACLCCSGELPTEWNGSLDFVGAAERFIRRQANACRSSIGFWSDTDVRACWCVRSPLRWCSARGEWGKLDVRAS